MTHKIQTKQETRDLVDRQLAFYKHLPCFMKPDNLARIGHDTYSYQWVEGRMPCNEMELDSAYRMAHVFWCGWLTSEERVLSPLSLIEVNDFVDYVASRSALIKDSVDRSAIIGVMSRLYEEEFMPVLVTHGDLTRENIVISNSGWPVFIDPGFSRLMCQEIDEAKLLQSILTQWEVIHHGNIDRRFVGLPPFEVRPVHLLLLLTHWVRLAAYPEKHSEKVQRYATRIVIPELLKEVHNAYTASDFRHRWGSCELQERCIRSIQDSL